MPAYSPIPSFQREGSSVSMMSSYSKTASHASRASVMGPLTRESLKMKDTFRAKTARGTKYVVKFNRHNFHIDKISDKDEEPNNNKDEHSRTQKRSKSRRRAKSRFSEHRSPRPMRRSHTAPELIKFGFSARPTASGLIDPWEDLSMDRKILPKIQDKPLVTLSPYSSPYSSRKNKKKSTPRGSKEGSTMCPQFPVVTMPVREWETKPLTYNDVPNMRKHLDKVYMKINSKDKTNVEYVRTKQDFYRMDLDKLGELHPSNRGRMKQTYNAYLTNTPGSKQAIQECLKQAAGNSNNSDQSQTQQEMQQQQQEAQ